MASGRSWRGFGFWPSFTDVMIVTLLILLFFLFAHMTLNNDALISAQILHAQRGIADEVRAALGPDSSAVTIVADGSIQRISFSDRVLFLSGDATLLRSGVEILGRVGSVLYDRRDRFRTVQVEGHTDDRPIHTPRFPSNWELSTARATSVVRFLQDEARLAPEMLSANGYSEYRPVDPADTEAARALNRRVDLVLVFSTRAAAVEAGAAVRAAGGADASGPVSEDPHARH